MLIRKLRDDCTGFLLPYVALTLVVIVGMAALALDGSRLMSVQSQFGPRPQSAIYSPIRLPAPILVKSPSTDMVQLNR